MAETEKKQLFRQKSIDTIESPEAMNDYLHVTTPGVWMLLGVIIIFLIGVLCWGFFGTITGKTSVAVLSDGETTVAYIPEAALDSTLENPVVNIIGKNFTMSPSTLDPVMITDDTNIYVIRAGKYNAGDIVYKIPVDEVLPENVYPGTVITEEITPISFLLNN